MGQNADFMPIDAWDHLELYVGNAKQAAYYYRRGYGFRWTGYQGPETGVRDRAKLTVRTQTRVLRLATSWVDLGVRDG